MNPFIDGPPSGAAHAFTAAERAQIVAEHTAAAHSLAHFVVLAFVLAGLAVCLVSTWRAMEAQARKHLWHQARREESAAARQ